MRDPHLTPTLHVQPHVQRLLDALRAPQVTRAWSVHDWDITVRTARLARLLAVLAHHIQTAGLERELIAPIRHQLQGALTQSHYLVQMLRVELARVATVLASLNIEGVLLKGAAYVLQGLPIAPGRIPNDVDVLVSAHQLPAAEASLRAAGWRFEAGLDAYDQHYYRAWSHELPPLRYPGAALELDLHHAILPPTTRVSPPTALLVSRMRRVAGTPWFAWAPEDQILHLAAHVFIDSDCTSKLRDLVDLDTLLTHFCAVEKDFIPTLSERARELRLVPALTYALPFVQTWFTHTADQTQALQRLDAQCNASFKRSSWVVRLARHTLPPHHPDVGPTRKARWATRLLSVRYQWWRMPLRLVLYHAVMKGMRRLRKKRSNVPH